MCLRLPLPCCVSFSPVAGMLNKWFTRLQCTQTSHQCYFGSVGVVVSPRVPIGTNSFPLIGLLSNSCRRAACEKSIRGTWEAVELCRNTMTRNYKDRSKIVDDIYDRTVHTKHTNGFNLSFIVLEMVVLMDLLAVLPLCENAGIVFMWKPRGPLPIDARCA